MRTLHVPVGIPGCGKSTWAADLDLPIVSSDRIREQVRRSYVRSRKDGYRASDNKAVFRTFHAELSERLEQGSAVADATNVVTRHRDDLVRLAHDNGAAVRFYVFRNVIQAVQRNRQRGGHEVPREAMVRMLRAYRESLPVLGDDDRAVWSQRWLDGPVNWRSLYGDSWRATLRV